MKNITLKMFAVLMSVALMTSCLDDDKAPLDPDGSHNVIEFKDPSVPASPAGAIYPVWTAVTEISPSFQFTQEISYSGANANDSDIQLTLAIDPVAIEAYNNQMEEDLHGSLFTMMPDNYYSFDDFSVTIPKGQKTTTISIEVFPDQFDLTKNFALPLRIVSASEGVISANFSVALLAVVVKNPYDGIYTIEGGSIARNSATGPDPNLSGPYVEGLEIALPTIDGNTNGFDPVWKDGSGIAGITGSRLKIDPVTNQVTASATTNPLFKNTPATINQYDPATRTFTLNFDWGAAPNTRVVTGMILKYDRPR
jgi:hypothetical protein